MDTDGGWPKKTPLVTEPRLVPLSSPRKQRPLWRHWGLLLLTLTAIGLATLLMAETRTSHLQSREISRYAGTLTHAMAPGRSDRIVFPRQGPFDQRLGYTRLPDIQTRLLASDYRIDGQVRLSPALLDYQRRGFFPPYPEKTQAGLTLEECRGAPLYRFRHPQRQYPDFAAIPPLVIQSLLFIENRELLDAAVPRANPAVDWPRFTRAALSQLGTALHLSDQSSGGSTLATQIEKYRHSPGGLTGSPMEKLRQMVSASVRGYQQGPQTLSARQEVALDYLNSVPLAAAPGYGEIHGIADGLWVWFGTDFDRFNRLLGPGADETTDLAARGLAQRQVLALMIAQRRPSWYLNGGRSSLGALTDSYLRLMGDAGVIEARLREAALAQELVFRDDGNDRLRPRLESDKGRYMARSRLGQLVGVSLHELDRLDLQARTTLHGDLQREVTDYLKRLADPSVADAIGLLGERLLSPDQTAEVRYGFTLFERGDDGFRVRVQTDNTDQPFDINSGSKLELGSTAKLRVLATYLEIIAELHARHAGSAASVLRQIEVDPQDALSRWVIDRLLADPDLRLDALLDAAMQRRYSASPHEGFFTGGGRHTFSNFSPRSDSRRPTLAEAFQESINLPFVRLMRDLVNYSIHQNENRRRLLEDDQDPRRHAYLARFADREGRVFLLRFWRKYQDMDSAQRLDTFLEGLDTTPIRLAAVYRYLFPEADRDSFASFIAERLPAKTPSEARLDALYAQLTPGTHSLSDQAYLARVHPLDLWLLGFLLDDPTADYQAAMIASRDERQDVYGWLFNTRHRSARDSRIRTLLEVEAFLDIHRRWQRLGYPFDHLVPSLATALGSSGDRPSALAELVGIILNDGVRVPSLRIDELHFAANTPYETRFVPGQGRSEQVMHPAVATTLRNALAGVVEGGTARRLQGGFTLDDDTPLALGGKTGTGNNRFETVSASGQVIDSRARNRTATFVFYLGDDHFGTLTAYVAGSESDDFRFTSALPVQVLKGMEAILMPHLEPGNGQCLPPTESPRLMAEQGHPLASPL